MNVQEALSALGVRHDTLSQAEKDQLEAHGYLPLPDLIPAETLDRLRWRTDELIALEGAEAGKEVHQEAGATRLSDLVNKDPVFDLCFTHPRVLAAISHVLKGDLCLSSLNYRAALPGAGLQGLHQDWSGPTVPGDYWVCNSIWLLDDFTERNGATRLVPGSQRSGKTPNDAMADPSAPHPDEVILTAPAGTVVIFNSHIWHGGTLNRTDRPRRGLHAYFCRRSHPQQLIQKNFIRPETYARLSEAARFILDV
jgi:ectoine hydroxylase-related dioxygenase (phytanoyl-CoA dioxygenase family)